MALWALQAAASFALTRSSESSLLTAACQNLAQQLWVSLSPLFTVEMKNWKAWHDVWNSAWSPVRRSYTMGASPPPREPCIFLLILITTFLSLYERLFSQPIRQVQDFSISFSSFSNGHQSLGLLRGGHSLHRLTRIDKMHQTFLLCDATWSHFMKLFKDVSLKHHIGS